MRTARAFVMTVLVLAAPVLGSCNHRPVAAAPVAVADLDTVAYRRAPVAAAPAPEVVYAAQVAPSGAYRLDSGDRLRIVVYGQDGLTNSYNVDASGAITMPLIGAVKARGLTPAELSRAVAARLREGFIREPFVATEVEAYRPFFILGEVAAPGQYPYVPNLTAEAAIAIAGGFTPRAQRNAVNLSRNTPAGALTDTVPLTTPIAPGDTLTVRERWF
jgi:polysaccharide export outer membrane protein